MLHSFSLFAVCLMGQSTLNSKIICSNYLFQTSLLSFAILDSMNNEHHTKYTLVTPNELFPLQIDWTNAKQSGSRRWAENNCVCLLSYISSSYRYFGWNRSIGFWKTWVMKGRVSMTVPLIFLLQFSVKFWSSNGTRCVSSTSFWAEKCL